MIVAQPPPPRNRNAETRAMSVSLYSSSAMSSAARDAPSVSTGR